MLENLRTLATEYYEISHHTFQTNHTLPPGKEDAVVLTAISVSIQNVNQHR